MAGDHSQITNQIEQELNKSRIHFKESVGISVCACATKTATYALVEASECVKWLLFLCFSCMTSNEGKEAGFPAVSNFGGLMQKVFAHSYQEKLSSSTLHHVSLKIIQSHGRAVSTRCINWWILSTSSLRQSFIDWSSVRNILQIRLSFWTWSAAQTHHEFWRLMLHHVLKNW